MNTQDMFFNFTRRVEVKQGDPKSAVNVINGVSWDSIERYFTDENGILNIVLKSQTEGYKLGVVYEGKKLVEKQIKTTINVVITVEEVEDVKRFLAHLGIHPPKEEAKIKPEITGMD